MSSLVHVPKIHSEQVGMLMTFLSWDWHETGAIQTSEGKNEGLFTKTQMKMSVSKDWCQNSQKKNNNQETVCCN